MSHYEFEKKLQKDLGLRHRPDRFQNRDAAFRWAKNCLKLKMVMLGCDGRFWVVCGADASRLHKLGYEYAV